jgi:hypothetical protein
MVITHIAPGTKERRRRCCVALVDWREIERANALAKEPWSNEASFSNSLN